MEALASKTHFPRRREGLASPVVGEWSATHSFAGRAYHPLGVAHAWRPKTTMIRHSDESSGGQWMAADTDVMGPVGHLVVALPGNKMTGDGLPILVDLVDRGLIRVLDLI